MSISSINTNIAAQYAQQNISNASSSAQASVARLSSGNRIVQASDDVAGLSIGTSLQTQVSALNTALTNASQATSLLQVADGALAQIQSILQQQKSIALQAGSGSLTDTDRGFLNQQFQALSDQINNLTSSTTFNGVGLLDGSLSQTVAAHTSSNTAAAASAALSFTSTTANDTIIINGVTLSLKAAPAGAGQVQIGASVNQTVQNLADYLNKNATGADTSANALTQANRDKLSGAVYTANGANLVITSRTGGTLPQTFQVQDVTQSGATGVYTTSGAGSNYVTTIAGFSATSIDSTGDANGPVVAAGSATSLKAGTYTLDGAAFITVANTDSLRTIVSKINATTATSGVTAFVSGSSGNYTLNIRGNQDSAALGVFAAGTGAVGGSITNTATAITGGSETLSGGANDGIGQGSVTATGSTGGTTSILSDQSVTSASTALNFSPIAPGNLAANLSGLNFVFAGQTFTFSTNGVDSTSSTEVAIGSTLEETLDNAVSKINAFQGDSNTNYQFNQVTATRNGDSLILTAKGTGAVQTVAGATTTLTNGTVTSYATVSGSLAAPTITGVDASNVSNADFIGTIGGVTATFNSANKVDLSLTIGGSTYVAKNVSTLPSANTDVRLVSDNGGYLTINLRAGQGESVADQAGADDLASRINTALSGLTFSQNRAVTSYNPSGDLAGSSISVANTDFSNIKISNIAVTAPAGTNVNGSISFTINGDTYTNLNTLGGQIGANAVVTFADQSDPSKTLTFKNGSNSLDISTANAASTLQTALQTALGVGTGDQALSFQVGTTSASTVKVSIDNASTSNIFGGQVLDVSTAADAANAASVLDTAISSVTAIRAGVGALQTQFGFASAALQSSVQNQDAARSQFLDTDIAAESTKYATSQVKLQAGISVLAQANQQLQALLKLIG